MATKKYDVWSTRDGREIRVSDMSDLHLLHTIRAIIEGRVLADEDDGALEGRGDPEGDTQTVMYCLAVAKRNRETAVKRKAWLTVFKGEAVKRGLDWKKAPTKKMSLVSWLCEECFAAGDPLGTAEAMNETMRKYGIAPPQIDVTTDGREVPTYCHWLANEGAGTPLKNS